MEKLQKRLLKGINVEIREGANDNERVIEGVLPYNSPSERMYIGYGDYGVEREVITPTAWKKTLADHRNIFLNYNHDSSLILGSTKSGTMTTESKEDGLHFRAKLPGTDIGIRAYETIKRKDVTTLSFEFVPVEWRTDNESKTIYVESGRLDAISVCVTNPAYAATDCQARNLSEQLDELKQTIKEKKELEEMTSEEAEELKEILNSILEKLPKEEAKPEEDTKVETPVADDRAESKEPTSKQPEDTSTDDTKEDADQKAKEEELKELMEELATLKAELKQEE